MPHRDHIPVARDPQRSHRGEAYLQVEVAHAALMPDDTMQTLSQKSPVRCPISDRGDLAGRFAAASCSWWLVVSLAGGLLIPAAADTWQVPGDFGSVQAALLATNRSGAYIVQTGDDILMGPGVHAPFALYGDPERQRSRIQFHSLEGPENTIVDANGGKYGIKIGVPNCTVRGLTVTNVRGENATGVDLWEQGSTVEKVTVMNVSAGGWHCTGMSLWGPDSRLQDVTVANVDGTGLELRRDSRAVNLQVHNCSTGVDIDSTGSGDLSSGSQLVSALISSNDWGVAVGNRCLLKNLMVENNRNGLWFRPLQAGDAGDSMLVDCVVRSNGVGVSVVGFGRLVMTRSLVYGNSFQGLLGFAQDGLIYDNAFFSNRVNVSDVSTECQYSVGRIAGTNIVGGTIVAGNFYDDYAGRDLDGDRIGDTRTPHLGVDPDPLLTDSPEPRADVAIVDLALRHQFGGSLRKISGSLTITNRSRCLVWDVPYVIYAASNLIVISNTITLEAGKTTEWRLWSWDPYLWLTSLGSLVAKPVDWSGTLAAMTNLSLRAVLDPSHTLDDRALGDNVSREQVFTYGICPDLALQELQLLQVNRHADLIRYRPMMARARLVLDDSAPLTYEGFGPDGSVLVYPGRDLFRTNLFEEIQGADFRVTFNDGNSALRLDNHYLFPRSNALYAVPEPQAAAFRTELRTGDPKLIEPWLYRQGVDRLNFEYDPRAQGPYPRGAAGTQLEAEVSLQGSDADWQNNQTNAIATVRETSPEYRILFKALDSLTTEHVNSVARHKLLIKQHCEFVEAIFPVVKVAAFYDDDVPDVTKPPADPDTITSYSIQGAKLAWEANAWRRPENGSYMSTVYLVPRGVSWCSWRRFDGVKSLWPAGAKTHRLQR